MLGARGTKRFYELSNKLYGSAKDLLPDGKTTVRDMGIALYEQLTNIAWEKLGDAQKRDIDAASAAAELNRRLGLFFEGSAGVRVEVGDAMVADAAAGSDYVKIRNRRDVLEARHRYPRGARGVGAPRDELERASAAGRALARERAAAHRRRARRARGARRDPHVPIDAATREEG